MGGTASIETGSEKPQNPNGKTVNLLSEICGS
jgi:hypothetical protein